MPRMIIIEDTASGPPNHKTFKLLHQNYGLRSHDKQFSQAGDFQEKHYKS